MKTSKNFKSIAELEAEITKYKNLYESCLRLYHVQVEISDYMFSRVQVLEAEKEQKQHLEKYSPLRIVR